MTPATFSEAECIAAMKAIYNRLVDIEFASGRDLFEELRKIEDAIAGYQVALEAEPDPDAAMWNEADRRHDDRWQEAAE